MPPARHCTGPEGERRDLHLGRGPQQHRPSSGLLWQAALFTSLPFEDTRFVKRPSPCSPPAPGPCVAFGRHPAPALAIGQEGAAVVVRARSAWQPPPHLSSLIHPAAHSLPLAGCGGPSLPGTPVAIYLWPRACVNREEGAREAPSSHRGILFSRSGNCSSPAGADHLGGALC